MTSCCPCDKLIHPSKLDISAGLDHLPRQADGFPEYRLAMLRDIPGYAPLSDWRAREGDDLGIMLIEMWAYVLDTLGFYDEQIANESYLRTAMQNLSTRQLVELIGYLPRPALASSVVLAAIADGNKPVVLPEHTGFRSDAFGSESPQIFETEYKQTIHKLKNKWELGEVREPISGDELLLKPSSVALTVGEILVRRTENALRPFWVTNISTVKALDGNKYKKVEASAPITFRESQYFIESTVGSVPAKATILSPTKTALLNNQGNSVFNQLGTNGTSTRITLDSIYPELSEGEFIVVQRGRELYTRIINRIERKNVPVNPSLQVIKISEDSESGDKITVAKIPVSQITISPDLPSRWVRSPERLILHYCMRKAGELTSTEKSHINIQDFNRPGISLKNITEPLPKDIQKPSNLLLQDAQDNGVFVGGSVDIDDKGKGVATIAAATEPFDPKLRTPVTAYGNLVHATRGESVFNEILGSGDAAKEFQTFTLANNPLTYFNNPSAPNGRRNTLEVRVNGIKWTEVTSFFGTGPEDQAYIVRQNEKEEFVVIFGTGDLCARLPSGIDNVIADYRFGAGAAKPPAGAIQQIARPVEGLGRVLSPIAPGGGADADETKDVKTNAQASALLFGRAVSLIDFEALAREFGGVINAEAHWAWDEAVQRAVVKIWYISDGGNIKDDLVKFLVAQSAPDVPISAEQASAQMTMLAIDVLVDDHYDSATLKRAVVEKLSDESDGILSPRHITIARPLFRSRIFREILDTEGVTAVEHVTVDGSPIPFALKSNEGEYRVFDIRI